MCNDKKEKRGGSAFVALILSCIHEALPSYTIDENAAFKVENMSVALDQREVIRIYRK